MRKATQDNGLIVDEGKFIGIALGYDYCAEHEWGIKDLKRTCGMTDVSRKNMGVKNRTITTVPLIVFKEEVVKRATKKKKKGSYAMLYTGTSWRSQAENEENVPRDLRNYIEDLTWNEEWKTKHPSSRGDNDNIITAWDGGSFGVAVMGEKEVEWLRELKTAIEEKRLTIAVANLRAKNPFAGSSLCLMITDRIPQETLDMMYYGDKEYLDREDYEKKTGVPKLKEKVRNARQKDYQKTRQYDNLYGHNHGYNIACSPKWIDYNDAENRKKKKEEFHTKYDIIYWINYSDDDNTHGWFSVEEIKEWLGGKEKLSEIRKKNEEKYGKRK